MARALPRLGFFLCFGLAAACAGNGSQPPQAPSGSAKPLLFPEGGATKEAKAYTAPTVDEAREFLARVDKDLRRLWIARDRAGWVNQNFITDDSEAIAAAGEEATAEYVTRVILEARRFDKLPLPPEMARQFTLLKLAQVVPAPEDPEKRKELAEIQTWMQSTYGKGEYCPPAGSKLTPAKGQKCLKLDDLSRTLKKGRNYDELLEAWTGWHQIARPMREKYTRYVELGNEGAKTIGFADLGALWRSGYDMTPEAFTEDLERLWQEVKPLYEQLHCYVRGKLQKKYGEAKVPAGKPVPAHLLGNMWAQDWTNIYDLVEPYPGQGSLDVDKRLKDKKVSPTDMVKLGERFFTSLGLDPLPKSFWERSLFTRPKDREVVCHASAWDVSWNDDVRIKMCIEPTEDDLITIHHELGHDYYFHQYTKLPVLFQQGANDGFHEGIGDTLALAVTPSYLKSIDLLSAVPKGDKAQINVQMKQALEKIAFLPFGLLIDRWRWEVFSGRTPKDKYNEAWWALRTRYQGITPPNARTESDFDPGAKYHVPSSTPYSRYFLARIYQFQFYRALCKASGHTGPLATCSFYGSKEAGEKLKAMLTLGASKPWPEAMQVVAGESKADATAMLTYFEPLEAWLKEQNKGQTCGW